MNCLQLQLVDMSKPFVLGFSHSLKKRPGLKPIKNGNLNPPAEAGGNSCPPSIMSSNVVRKKWVLRIKIAFYLIL
jgi:hypothetical protein